MTTRRRLIALLAQGGFHSGEQLAQQLGITRAAVWKHIQSLHALGLSVDRVPGKGYRLAEKRELIDVEHIKQGLQHSHPTLDIHVFDTLTSTNQHLMQQAQLGAASATACLAEHQSQGKGRRGRQWISPFASNLYLSLLWRFNEAPRALGALPLGVAVAVCDALQQQGYPDIQIKWPNDLLYRGQKLGGILVEMAGDPTGRCHVVVGIGINVQMPTKQPDIDQPWTSLDQIGQQTPSRNDLATRILAQVATLLQQTEQHGSHETLLEQWRQRDAYANQPVRLLRGEQIITGIARGIDDEGNLLLDTQDTLQRFHSGEISLRPLHATQPTEHQ